MKMHMSMETTYSKFIIKVALCQPRKRGVALFKTLKPSEVTCKHCIRKMESA